MVQGVARLLPHAVAAIVFGTVGFALGGMSAAAASPTLVLAPAQGPGGTSVTASGTGWCASPCTDVVIDFAGEAVATVAARADGTFQTVFQVPGGALGGSNFVTASQQTAQSPPQTNRAFAGFKVTPSQPAPSSGNGQPQQTAPATPTSRTGPPTAPPVTGSGAATTSPGTVSSPTATGSAAEAVGGGPAGSGRGGLPGAVIAALVLAAILIAGGATIALRRRRS